MQPTNDMEHDMLCSSLIKEKCAEDRYAQNLYAAMCNIDWGKSEMMPILLDQRWSCSWRTAGGIVANIREEGNYLDWYCSGIGEGLGNGDPEGTRGYVSEGTVTDEIREDLKSLGWHVVEEYIH